MTRESLQETLRCIRHEFMAYRNGIVADTLRKAGMEYKVIFGLQLPQLSKIANSYSPQSELASALWNDKDCRETRLLACYLFNKDTIELPAAFELACGVQTQEEADILAFRLLRFLPYLTLLHNRLLQTSDTANVSPDSAQSARLCLKALGRFM